ncbi:MAG: hypothetical protein KGI51_15315, partial [Rhodospirillales bacterium]|nr:hypothetical protein [Rhodospirillales bacterium]
MTDAPPHPLAARFAQFVAFLLEGIGECGIRRQIAGPLTFRLERRFNKMARRFAALVAHLAAFGVDAPRRTCTRKQPPPAAAPPDPAQEPAQAPAQDSAPPQAPPPRPDWLHNPLPKWARPAAARRPAPPLSQAVRVPSRRAWLAGLSLHVNGAIARLQHLMYEPEMASLLAASPRLVALLRPLCRMLAVEFPHGILPPRPPRPPRQPRPRRRRWHPPRRGDLH